MQQKVRNLLLRTRMIPENGSKSKPGVVVLTAKADVAQKMVGIVEIAKRAIEKEDGQWWQYNKIHGQMIEPRRKEAKTKQAKKGKIPAEPEEAQTEKEGCTIADATRSQETNPQVSAAIDKTGDEDEDDEAAFQTMGEHQVMLNEGNRSKVRAIPIMTIHMSRFSVPELRAHCE